MKKKLVLISVLILSLLFSSLWLIACDAEDTKENKEDADTTVYTVSDEEWAEAVDLKWKNLTYEFRTLEGSHAENSPAVTKLLADGSLYTNDPDNWGTKYVIYRTETQKWETYQGNNLQENSDPSFVYDTAEDYISGSYGDDFGFGFHLIPQMLSNEMREYYTFDSKTNQYVAKNYKYMGEYPMHLTAKFENAKLVYFKMEPASGEGETMEGTFSDYGTTTIDFPSWMID